MTSFEVEIREGKAGYEPMLRGVMLSEGRAASGGRREVFAPESVIWPHNGVAIALQHYGEVETRAQVIRARNGQLTITARATEGIRRAVAEGKTFMSVEFQNVKDRVTKGGVREILAALVEKAVLTDNPEFDTTKAEVRDRQDTAALIERAIRWL